MSADLATIRARAREHQDAIDLAARFFTPQELADRWHLSRSTVMLIPRDELPFTEFGTGRIKRRRRYRPEDVASYETRGAK